MEAINSSLDDVIKKGKQEKRQQQTPAKRSQGITKRSGPIRSSSGRGASHRKSPIHGRRDTDSPWKHDLYEQASNRGGQRDISSGSSITSRLGGALGSNTIKVENLHYEVTEADVNELFKMVGPCSAKLQFDRSGRSSGTANVKFDKAGDAQTAVKKYNNVELDGQAMKISLVDKPRSDGILSRISGGGQGNKNSSLNRIGQGNSTNTSRGGRRPNNRGRGGGHRQVRSENDLDKEMDAYMGTPAQSTSNPFYMQTAWFFNVTRIHEGYSDSSTSKTASSQDFQTVFPYLDEKQYQDNLDRVVLNFGTACKATTNFTTVQALNNNTISSLGNATVVALIERSTDCMWAEKLSTAQSIASANYLKMTAAIIYDNVYYPGSDPVINATVGSTSTPVYPNPLQPERNISLMQDNNVMTGGLNIAVYFASNAYGTNLSALVKAANANSATDNKEVWLFAAVLYPTCWTNCPSAMGFLFAASKGYLSYIIALAAAFVIGAVALNWWRMRRMRNQLELHGVRRDLEHGIVMRTRATKSHPLPVDILNTYPVEHYSPSIIKNASCAICLDDFTPEKDNIRILPCGHGFCTICIDPWLTEKSRLCPICKFDCLPPELRENTESVEQNQLQVGSASPFTSPSAAAAAALATDSTVATESADPTEPVAPAESDASMTSSSSSSTVSTPVALPDAENPTSSPSSNNHESPDTIEPPVDHQNVDDELMTPPPAEQSSAEHKPVIE